MTGCMLPRGQGGRGDLSTGLSCVEVTENMRMAMVDRWCRGPDGSLGPNVCANPEFIHQSPKSEGPFE